MHRADPRLDLVTGPAARADVLVGVREVGEFANAVGVQRGDLGVGDFGGEPALVVCNLTPLPRVNYVLGVPHGGVWAERLNSDAVVYGGSGWGNLGDVTAAPLPSHGRPHSLTLALPPLSTLILTPAQFL